MTVAFRRFTSGEPSTPAVRQPFPLPSRLERWQLRQAVGSGSLSRVYRATACDYWPEPTPIPRAYAIKVLRERWETRPKALDQFASEVAVAREVAHPHLISLVDARLHEPPYYLVMPWLSGNTLSCWRRGPRPPWTAAAQWVGQIAAALQALASAGWMHADVKPSNIIIDDLGQATLIDLGFARRTGPHHDEPRPLAGTLNYMSPEMITAPDSADIRSDLYSLGVTLFELLSGQLPFTGGTPTEIARAHCDNPPPDLAQLAPNLPVELRNLVARLLAKSAAERPQSPGLVSQQLLNWAQPASKSFAAA